MNSPEHEYPDLDAELRAILQEKEDIDRESELLQVRGAELLSLAVKRFGWADVDDYKRHLLDYEAAEYELSSEDDKERQEVLFLSFLEAVGQVDHDVKEGELTDQAIESQKLYVAFHLVGDYGAEWSRPFRELLDEITPHLRPVKDLTEVEYQVFEQFQERRDKRNKMIRKITSSAVEQYRRSFGMSEEAKDVIYQLFLPDMMMLMATVENDDDAEFARIMAHERNDEWEAEFSGEALEKFRSIRTSYLTRLFIVLMDPNLKDL